MKVNALLKKILFRKERKILEPVYIPVLSGTLLSGRRALITGGGKGIGYAIAKAFLEQGSEVCITGRDEKVLQEAVSGLSATGSRITYRVLDVTDTTSFDRTIQELIASWGMIDVLVNNAGVNDYAICPDVDVSAYDRVMDTNLRGAFFLSQVFVRKCVKRGKKTNILNVCSSSSLRPGVCPYVLSKWGLRAMTVGFAKRFANVDCVVNGLAPGLTAVDRIRKESDGLNWERSPVGRMATAIEIANMAVVLVSDISRMVVGDVVYMTGGMGVVTVDDNC